MRSISTTLFTLCFGVSWLQAPAQFVDNFETSQPPSNNGWRTNTGDGSATIQFVQKSGYASVYVDATKDKLGIWWAIVARNIDGLDLQKLEKPGYELRAEARIRVSHAPRRVNLSFNTQRTTDFHSNLMEYDIPDTTAWHVISLTTENFDGKPGDRITAQMALMDWGFSEYRVDIDYYKVDVVERASAGADLGDPLPYRPPMPDPSAFREHVRVAQDATLDTNFPDMNFNNWQSRDGTVLLTAGGSQLAVMRWDLSNYTGRKVTGPGLLELKTHDIESDPDYVKDFGTVHVSEILGGKKDWDQKEVSFELFLNGQPFDEVINSQMFMDVEKPPGHGEVLLITVSQPVLQRLIDGRTRGISLRPLGAVNASFFSMENEDGKYAARLHFNVK